MTTATDTNAASKDFVIARKFDAPRNLVWRAFTEIDLMKQWWAPKGFTPYAAKMDLRPGGTHHYALKGPDGSVMWGKLTYREIAAPERLVFVTAFSDEAGGLTRHPMSPTWPLEMLTTITFDEQGGGTLLTVRWSPLNPSDEERKTFDTSHDGMRQGWTGTLDNLADHLAKF